MAALREVIDDPEHPQRAQTARWYATEMNLAALAPLQGPTKTDESELEQALAAAVAKVEKALAQVVPTPPNKKKDKKKKD